MAEGKAHQLAMQLVEQAAAIMEAPRLIPISFAHIDACFYTGQSHVDFVRFLLEHDAKLSRPTWTNNSVASPDDGGLAPNIPIPKWCGAPMNSWRSMPNSAANPPGPARPISSTGGPKFGDHIAVGESNAVAFYNSVVGARTNKYGDYLDVACAITGLAPFAGLHTDEGRRADIHFSCASIPDEWKRQDIFFHLLGHFVGRKSGRRIPVISGSPKRNHHRSTQGPMCRKRRLRRCGTPACRGRDT